MTTGNTNQKPKVVTKLFRRTANQDTQSLSLLLTLLEMIRKEIDTEAPSQMIAVFIRVALNDGITMNALVEETGMSQSSISRNIAALADKHRLGFKGHGLVCTMEDPSSRRRKIVSLTPKGKQLKRRVIDILSLRH